MFQSNGSVILPQFFFLYTLFPGFVAPKDVYSFGVSQKLHFFFKKNAVVAPRQTPSLEDQGLFCQGNHTLDANS